MRALGLLISSGVWLSCSIAAFGFPLPSFYLEKCAWEATDIVIVTAGEKIEGRVEVLESWKGDLKKGNRITVPELAAFAPKEARIVSKRMFEDRDNHAPNVTCARMVLFLIRKKATAHGAVPATTTWDPADAWGKMKTSVVWIEDGNAYAFRQQVSAGPSLLILLKMTESDVQGQVSSIVQAQIKLSKAVKESDPAARTVAVWPLLQFYDGYVRGAIIRTLGESGPKCLPALRMVLKDDSLARDHLDDIVSAIVKSGGASVGPELTEIVREELAFWKRVGPGLKENWWNGAGLEWKDVDGLRYHYGRALAALEGMKTIRNADGRETVTEFRDFWRSLPQLAEIDQIDKACDALLAALRAR